MKGHIKMFVSILGFGVVGSGVAEVITSNASTIMANSNVELKLKSILDIRDFDDNAFSAHMTKNFDDILNDEETKIVVETMGGVNPAFEFVSKCLAKGKHVVTSNKELVAMKGFELLQIAKENNVNFMFEASVGGGIPIIRPISRCLAGNNIEEIAGILNGTSNFILTKMIVDGMSFADALKLAQDKGYAEKDPTADVEGFDALRKICILSALAYGSHVYPDGVYAQGISKITLDDVAYANDYDCVIKLIARSKKLDDGKILVMVSPCFIKNESMLAGVNGVFNACLVRGDATGDVLMYGQGAGKLATASAVVGDIIDCASHDKERKFISWSDSKDGALANYLDAQTALYVKLGANDDTKEKIAAAFGDVTYLSKENAPANELAFVTGTDIEKVLREKLDTLGCEVLSTIRVASY
ncbi:MAG: homoserine dehydrogenase [Clostridia bacterium]